MAQLKRYRKDLEMMPLRGNVGTRITKMERGDVDAVVLAYAGINRIGETRRISQVIDPEVLLPAVGQGVLGLEVREADTGIRELLQPLHDPSTAVAVSAERAFLACLHGGCQVPIGGLGVLSNGMLWLTGLVASMDGSECIRKEIRGSSGSAVELGTRLADEVLTAGGAEILKDVYGSHGR
jgi:hydroxymethylbilane synthase